MAEGGASFSDFDTPHGLAKRRLVKGYCGGLFGRELESAKFVRPMSTCKDEFRVAYIDAFCWRGSTGSSMTGRAPEVRRRVKMVKVIKKKILHTWGVPLLPWTEAWTDASSWQRMVRMSTVCGS